MYPPQPPWATDLPRLPPCRVRRTCRKNIAQGVFIKKRPWQATASSTSWTDDSDDPEARVAADQLNAAILRQYIRRAEAYLVVRGEESAEWRAAAGFSVATSCCSPQAACGFGCCVALKLSMALRLPPASKMASR